MREKEHHVIAIEICTDRWTIVGSMNGWWTQMKLGYMLMELAG
jgi:hypothetical protein